MNLNGLSTTRLTRDNLDRPQSCLFHGVWGGVGHDIDGYDDNGDINFGDRDPRDMTDVGIYALHLQ